MLSIVIPAYNEEDNVPRVYERLAAALDALDYDWEVIFSVDPSTDRTEKAILDLRAVDPRVRMLRFSRRFGQPTATIAGLEAASGDAVIVIDCDLQDPPELIGELADPERQRDAVREQPALQPAGKPAESRVPGPGVAGRDLFPEAFPLEVPEHDPILLLVEPERGEHDRSEVEAFRDDEAGVARLRAQLAPGVAALVPQVAVEAVVGAGCGGDDDDGATAGSQRASDLAEGPFVIGHVLEEVGAHDGVGGTVGEGEMAGVGLDERDTGEASRGAGEPGEHVVDADEVQAGLAAGQILEQVAARATEIDD